MTFAWLCSERGDTSGYIKQSTSEPAQCWQGRGDAAAALTLGAGAREGQGRARIVTELTHGSCRGSAEHGPGSHVSCCANSDEKFNLQAFKPKSICFRT